MEVTASCAEFMPGIYTGHEYFCAPVTILCAVVMLCHKCEDDQPAPERDARGSECGHHSLRGHVVLCERCSTRHRRCQDCGRVVLRDVTDS
jgi:hypothetical protein